MHVPGHGQGAKEVSKGVPQDNESATGDEEAVGPGGPGSHFPTLRVTLVDQQQEFYRRQQDRRSLQKADGWKKVNCGSKIYSKLIIFGIFLSENQNCEDRQYRSTSFRGIRNDRESYSRIFTA